MGYYPVYINLENRDCAVIGDGFEVGKKVDGLLAAGANIIVITEKVTPHLKQLDSQNIIKLKMRQYIEGDLKDIFLAIAATTYDKDLSSRIAIEAEREGVLLNVMDITSLCIWIAPAIVKRGDLAISISTSGRSPAMARFIRENIEERIPEEYGDLLEIVGQIRNDLRSKKLKPNSETWQKAIKEEIDRQDLGKDWESTRLRLKSSLEK